VKRNNLLVLGFAGMVLMSCPSLSSLGFAQGTVESQSVCLGGESLTAEINKITERLKAIEDDQQKILDGQKKLSEEHTQLRYWIHKN